ncbi:hypothetical protein B0T17DRAFT_602806 [Bombardia bombarda]|uniref:Endoplasmic reticulum junction formation protein lunapark n=1 Tax=Bombardia bombarda TaxID=252184 RepID=A0AA39TM66_9PEZI|nr:hypothetical protein B0T17DRAFT_602806 [Bombardia bombarda]
MVSLWPWRKPDSSPASFEKTLSTLSTKIASTQARLDKTRATARRVKVLSTLYIGFAYLVYAIVLLLVVGWKDLGALEWSGMAGGPVLIYVVRTVTSTLYDYRIDTLNSRLKAHQTERAKTIQKLKDATKYDSTLELLEKYGGGSDNKSRKGRKRADDDDNSNGNGGFPPQPGVAPHHLPTRTNMPPPPTANIERRPLSSGPSTPQPQSRPLTAASYGGSPPFQRPADQQQPNMDASAEFAPNAFDGKGPPPYMQYPPASAARPSSGPHWYDRILDTLLGEDETAAKNRIVLICGRCRLVNGQAPPGTKSLSEVGQWKCMACGVVNGEMDEGKRIVREVLHERAAATAETTDDDAGGNSSDLIEVDADTAEQSGSD